MARVNQHTTNKEDLIQSMEHYLICLSSFISVAFGDKFIVLTVVLHDKNIRMTSFFKQWKKYLSLDKPI